MLIHRPRVLRLAIVIILLNFTMSCHSRYQVQSIAWGYNDTQYLLVWSYTSNEMLGYLVIQHEYRELESIVTHGDGVDTKIIINNDIIELPNNDTQIFEYDGKILTRSMLHITKDEFIDAKDNLLEFTLEALEKYISQRRIGKSHNPTPVYRPPEVTK
jgi:hypothetical protein